jgi:hypothetical protein
MTRSKIASAPVSADDFLQAGALIPELPQPI